MTKQFHTFLSVSRLVTVLRAAAGPAGRDGERSPSDLCPPRDLEGTERQQEK